jgi:hypothetical protein
MCVFYVVDWLLSDLESAFEMNGCGGKMKDEDDDGGGGDYRQMNRQREI